MEKWKTSKALGIVVSYVNIAVTTIIAIVLTPYLINSLGESEYGLYQMMTSFASYLIVMNFGTSIVMTRYVALYRAQGDKKNEYNYIAMCLIITIALICIVALISVFLREALPSIYLKSLDKGEIIRGQILFSILAINICLTLLEQAFEGIIRAYERFSILGLLSLVKSIIRVGALIMLIAAFPNSVVIVIADLILTFGLLVIVVLYCFKILKIKIKLYRFDKILFIDSAIFSFAIFLQSIVNQINNNVDLFLLGIMISPDKVKFIVTTYSIAMSIYLIFSNLSTSVMSVYLPEATRLVSTDADGGTLTKFIIDPGRVQLTILGAIFLGFIICGRDFLKIWVGESYLPAWSIAIIIMGPMLLNQITGVAVSILDAMQKRLIRSIILVITAIANIILSILFIKEFGYIGAPIATSICTVIGPIIVMNIYYKRMGIQILNMYKSIFDGILPCLIVAATFTLPFVWYIDLGLIGFLFKGTIFTVLLVFLLLTFGFNTKEKDYILALINNNTLLGR